MTENVVKTIEVRTLAPAQRHSVIIQTYSEIRPEEAFEIIVDHDPKPLYYQFDFEHKGKFTWEYLENGPEVWRVRIGKTSV
jgi:uncharacterized protein (DUF2249 family)